MSEQLSLTRKLTSLRNNIEDIVPGSEDHHVSVLSSIFCYSYHLLNLAYLFNSVKYLLSHAPCQAFIRP